MTRLAPTPFVRAGRTVAKVRTAFLLFVLLLVVMSAPLSSVLGAPLAALSPTAPPFPECNHPQRPSAFFGDALRSARPLPTNRWWQNAVLATGDMSIVAYPYAVRLASPGSPLQAEAAAAQSTADTLTSRMGLTQTGVYMSLPIKEANEMQVIMPWRPEMLLTTPLYDVAAEGDAVATAAPVTGPNITSSAIRHSNRTHQASLAKVAVPRLHVPPVQSPIEAKATEIQMNAHQIVREDLLSVRVQWTQKNGAGRMLFPLVRGSPFITGIYSGLCPALYTGHAILKVNDADVPNAAATGPSASSSSSGAKCEPLTRHHVVLNSGATVLVYLDRPACAKWDRNRIIFDDPRLNTCAGSDWVVRVAMLHEMPRETLRNAVATLDAFRATVPVGGSVSFARDGEDRGPDFADATSTMRMQWRSVDISKETLRVDKAGALHAEARADSLSAHGVSSSDLLMLCLPHHKSVMTNMRPVNSLQPYDSIKGPLTPVAGNTWLLHLRHATTGSFYAQTSPLSAARPEWQEAIRTALHKDAMFNISAETTDPYGFGKNVAKLGRLALIADEIGGPEQEALARAIRTRLKAALEPWLEGTNSDPLWYDATWGGLVPRNGLKDFNADYGAGAYNDHHFHYGYFIYAFAAIVKEDAAWGHRFKEHMLAFVRDIANPAAVSRTAHDEVGLEGDARHVETDPFFPTFRYTDVFDGHSWANGFFASPSGRNSESSSEAINAYYAIALLGRALGDPSLSYLGEVLSSIEVHGVHHYWHMRDDRSAYPSDFARGKCVGMVWSDKAVQETWFAVGIAYVHAINILPITPISERVLSKKWVEEEYPVLVESLPLSRPLMDDAWLGFVHADLAVLRPEEAWTNMQSLTHFDNGASLTNFLYWVATRPTK